MVNVLFRYINVYGEEEAGIDAGGLFKDLMTDLSKIIFDPSYVSICDFDNNRSDCELFLVTIVNYILLL